MAENTNEEDYISEVRERTDELLGRSFRFALRECDEDDASNIINIRELLMSSQETSSIEEVAEKITKASEEADGISSSSENIDEIKDEVKTLATLVDMKNYRN